MGCGRVKVVVESKWGYGRFVCSLMGFLSILCGVCTLKTDCGSHGLFQNDAEWFSVYIHTKTCYWETSGNCKKSGTHLHALH